MLARAVAFAATIGVLGAIWFRLLVLGRGASDGSDATPPGQLARRVAVASAAVLAATVPWRVALQARSLSFEGDPWIPLVPRVLATSWGHAMIWQLAAALVAGGALMTARRHPAATAWPRAAVAAAVLAIVPALTGHAGASARLAPLAVAADAVHVAAAGGWMGALALLTAVAFREARPGGDGRRLAALIDAFHPLAQWSVAALAATGVCAAWLHLRAPSDVLTSDYGRLLTLKLVLVAAAAGLGWRHSRTASARARATGAGSVTGSLAAEWSLMLAVVALTAVLAGSPPPQMEQ